jgi:pSer/pThr/pTyr-binding forkhead associated (FHA) protein
MSDALTPKLKLLPDGPFIEIDWDSLFLGRDCHLAQHVADLKNKVVSNRHCCISKGRDGRWMVEDLRSTNGTWMDGKRLDQPVVLTSGAAFSMGRGGPRFEFLLPVAEDAGRTLPEEDSAFEATRLEAKSEGSADKPYKVGKTPEVRLRHRRTGEELRAKGYTIVLGRDAETVQILIRSDDQRHISGRHAELQFRSGGQCIIRDLESSNGTWLNEQALKGEKPLNVGDRIVLGSPLTTLVVEALDQ